MSREIRFRAIRKDNNSWIYGYYRAIGWSINKSTHYICNGNSQFEIIPESLGQFTGCFDVNGNQIFENDILAGYKCHYPVCFQNGAFMWDDELLGFIAHAGDDGNVYLEEEAKSPLKIIGNIHENKNLLK